MDNYKLWVKLTMVRKKISTSEIVVAVFLYLFVLQFLEAEDFLILDREGDPTHQKLHQNDQLFVEKTDAAEIEVIPFVPEYFRQGEVEVVDRFHDSDANKYPQEDDFYYY